mgnify:CR=1 FL=1
MKVLDFAAGVAVGMAAATAAVAGMYPGTSRKMKRDGKRLWRSITDMF